MLIAFLDCPIICTFCLSTRLASFASSAVLARPLSTPFSLSTSSVMPMFEEIPARIRPLRLSSLVTIARSTFVETSRVFQCARAAYSAFACSKQGTEGEALARGYYQRKMQCSACWACQVLWGTLTALAKPRSTLLTSMSSGRGSERYHPAVFHT